MSEKTAATAGFTKLPIDDMEAIWGGSFKRARAALGVSGFGVAVIDLPPDLDRVPAHMHTFDEQEEVFIPLAGSGWMEVHGERIPVDPETAVRVGPTASRRPISGPDGMRLLIVGGVPGRPYEPFFNSVAGAPEPPVKQMPGIALARQVESVDDHSAMRLDEMDEFKGAARGVTLYSLRRALGVSAFGMAVIDLEPHDEPEELTDYPLHDHASDGQEEVYAVVTGSGELIIDDQRVPVTAGEMIRVSPETKRKFVPSEGGLRLVAIGCTPGKAYEPPSSG